MEQGRRERHTCERGKEGERGAWRLLPSTLEDPCGGSPSSLGAVIRHRGVGNAARIVCGGNGIVTCVI